VCYRTGMDNESRRVARALLLQQRLRAINVRAYCLRQNGSMTCLPSTCSATNRL
jgi:hypothetical protein